MTLEESKELLKEMKESARLYHDKKAQLKVEAIDTVLKALEDSTPKEKIREKMKELGKDNIMLTPRYVEELLDRE